MPLPREHPGMKPIAMFTLAAAAALAGLASPLPATAADRLPEFTHAAPADWINSPPLTAAGLRGKAVLVEFWTFDCINCLRTVPWIRATEARYRAQGLVVIAVHTPELPRERLPANVRAAVQRLGIVAPVMIDDDYSYWHALGNQYWPAVHLYDRAGRRVLTEIGELHGGTPRARRVEAAIERALGSSPR